MPATSSPRQSVPDSSTRFRRLPSALRAILAVLAAAASSAACTSREDGKGAEAGLVRPAASETVIDASGSPQRVARDEVLVYLSESSTSAQEAAIRQEIARRGAAVVGFDPNLLILQVRTGQEEALIAALRDLPGVQDAGYNPEVAPHRANSRGGSAPAPQATPRLPTALIAPTLGGDWWIEAVHADTAWDVTAGSSLVTVGVVDTGLPADQEILAESRLSRFDATGAAITGDDSITAPKGFHGAWVTGFAAGFVTDQPNYSSQDQTGANVFGVDHVSDVVFVDVMAPSESGTGTFATDLAGGVGVAVERADVVNVSWGANTESCTDDACRVLRQKTFRAAQAPLLARARARGVLVVYSAGNDALKNDDALFERENLDAEARWRDQTLVVGASSNRLANVLSDATFSRDGSVVDLFAPGDDVGFSQSQVEVYHAGHVGDGTSYAAPLVTGAASLAKAVEPTLLPAELKHVLVASAPTVVTTDRGRRRHLDLQAALDSARLLRGTVLHTLSREEFTGPNTGRSVTLPVTIPASGVASMDVLFLVDVTGSFYDDIATLQAQALQVLADLSSRGIDVGFGVAGFADFPFSPWGSLADGDEAYYLLQPITTNADLARAAIDALYTRYGDDDPEAQLEALVQAATGAGLDIDGDGSFAGAGELLPKPAGWRAGAQRIVVLSTDSEFHDGALEPGYPGASMTETITALHAAGITVIGLQSGAILPQMDQVVSATGGAKYSLTSDSAGLAAAIADAVDQSTRRVDISYEVLAGQEFLGQITPASGFLDVPAGSEVTFSVVVRNPRQPSDRVDQDGDVILWVKADGSVIGRVRIPVRVAKKAG